MNAIKKSLGKCPNCGKASYIADFKTVEKYVCSKCAKIYETEKEAEKCCKEESK